MISGVVVRMGEVVVVRRSEARGGDEAIGSSGCIPSSSVAPRLATFLEVLEEVVEAEALGRGLLIVLAASLGAFLAARSASLEERCGAGCRLRAPPAGMVGAATRPVFAGISGSMSSRSIGLLRGKKRKRISARKDSKDQGRRARAYPTVLGAPMGIR